MINNCLLKVIEYYGFDINKRFVMKHHLETVNHMIRCFELAKRFGLYLGFEKDEIELLAKCALLHDLGKFQLNERVLYKSERLTNEEFAYLKTHTEIKINYNEELLEEVILDTMKYHHDNCLCTGYNKINIMDKHSFVRIVSIIDSFDAMTSKRCYKNNSSTEYALKEIFKNLGTQFDLFYGEKFICFMEEEKYTNIVG